MKNLDSLIQKRLDIREQITNTESILSSYEGEINWLKNQIRDLESIVGFAGISYISKFRKYWGRIPRTESVIRAEISVLQLGLEEIREILENLFVEDEKIRVDIAIELGLV